LTGVFTASAAIGLLAQTATPKPAPAAPQRGAAPAPQRGAAPAAPAAASATDRFTVIGCIARDAGTTGANARFTITEKRGEKPATYRLQGDPKELDIHTGHTVEITGPLSTQAAAGRGANAGALMLKVDKLTWISTSCSK
jgi:hypothetical protein